MMPDTVAADAQVDIAAEWRIPEMHRRRTARLFQTADHPERIGRRVRTVAGFAFQEVLTGSGDKLAFASSRSRIMPADFMQSDFALLFKRDCPLLDVRSPVEFARGAFPASTNIPLLTDAQRTEVGTMYRRSGGEAATRLGHKLVSGDSRSALIQRWRNFIERNPEARLYCFRGGQRSHVVQQWLREAGVEIPLVPGGYKALRGFLLHVLEEAAKLDFLVIAGKTGCGKTHLVTELPCALDIEGAARHRGSAFGALPDPQPSQIDFENAMAVALLKLEFESLPVLIAEDESRAVGSLAIPHVLFDRMKQAPLALIEESLEVRVETILHDYILANLAAWEERSPGRGAAILEQSLLESLERIRRRLGDGGFRKTGALMRQAFTVERQESLALHRRWISLLLENYYDPMYEYQLARKLPRVRCRGRREEIARWCRTYMSSSATA
ncbi:MAG: tRNA 2-selenouridine(34) synthase MnmH [Gammaproteobacteria bacterium]|nr:tRNA 2-selenouridine(34) synthase MnmH [Gammaproteobacteria bacterium]MYF00519.1 tRNA 2-selenouridine(34) synthase MnmH [Gammaproteobacteria bacterium]